MLAKGPKTIGKAAGLILLAVMAFGFVASFSSLPVRGDTPVIIENKDASRTVVWSINSSQGLTLQGTQVANGNATLPWRPYNVTWAPNDFLRNVSGTLDGNLTVGSAGVSLQADQSNHVVDGNFTTDVPWTYQSGPTGNVTVGWNSTSKSAVFRHDSPATEVQWDSLDNRSHWNAVNGVVWTNTTAPHEGTGMLGLNFTLPNTANSFAGAVRSTTVNWSAYDRMLVWVLPLNVSSPLTFNVTAYIGTNLRGTIGQPLVAGWQDILVNLTELGPSRDSLVSLTLQINGQNVPATTAYFDDIRVGSAKHFDETARIQQSIYKDNATSTAIGSATLRLNWSVPNAYGIASVRAFVNVSGVSSIERSFGVVQSPVWKTFVTDVSTVTSSRGWYNITIAVEVVADNTSASSVQVQVDDVSLVFPNRHNGTYLSNAIGLPADSKFLRVNWSLDASGGAKVSLSLRSGNDTSPGSPTWGAWETWTAAGTYSVAIPSAWYLQVKAILTTTNASVTPVVQAMAVGTVHREAQGSVISGIFTAPTDYPLLHWRTLHVVFAAPLSTNITFSIGPGTYWQSVAPNANLSALNWTEIQWKAVLSTAEGLATPTLGRVELVYEFLGPVVRLELTSPDSLTVRSGGWIRFTASALDAGSHINTSAPDRFSWSTSDPNGEVLNNGTYHAADVGDWNVTATWSLPPYYSVTKRVTVLAQGGGALPVPFVYLPLGLGLVVAAVVGYGGYELAIRRMFAIDDIFLISKEGRLLLHNTRRMRADRDEDILSAMFTAILTFLKDFDREENGDLRRFEFGRKTALLERGDHAYLAAVYSGRVPRWAGKDLRRFMSDLEGRFGKTFAHWSGDPDDLQGLKEFSERFVSRFRYRPSSSGKRAAR